MNNQIQTRSDAVNRLFLVSQEIGTDHENQLLSVVATWLMREAHLAIERAYSMVESGVPEETAWFVAIDDVGFQLAHAATEEWGAGKEADQSRQ